MKKISYPRKMHPEFCAYLMDEQNNETVFFNSDYEARKNRSFFGWFTQSCASEKAILEAAQAQSPKERYNALITNYLQKAPSLGFFQKPNATRSFAESITRVRPTALSFGG